MPTLEQGESEARPPARVAVSAAEAGRLARIVRVIGWAVAAGAIPSVAHNAVSGRWPSALVLLVAQAGALSAVALAGRGRLDAAVALLVGVIQSCAGALVVVGGHGFHDVAMLLFPATLVVAGLLMRRGAFAAVALATVAFVLAIGLAELGGLLVTDLSLFTFGRNLLDAAIILGVTAVAVSLLAESVRTSLARASEQTRLLQASEERFRSLIDLAVDGILIGDSQRRVVGANRRVEELTGLAAAELVGRPLPSLFSLGESYRSPFRFDLIESGQTVVSEGLLQRKDGTTIPVEMSSKKMPDGTYQSFIRDVTERRRAEEDQSRLRDELRQAQKVEALGRLAGGIAHDFNNMLMVVQSSLGLAIRKSDATAPVQRYLQQAEEATQRASALTRQLLTFGRRQTARPSRIDLHALVLNLEPMLRGLLGSAVKLELRARDPVPSVVVDAGQIEHALVNLAMNARDAMPEGGSLRVALATLDVGNDRAQALRLAAGAHVALEVSDTGVGISSEARQHLFEPFFTTKPPGHGTGLGLATAYGAVRENRGAIEVESVAGKGATFRLLFPIAPSATAPLAPSPGGPLAAASGGEETSAVAGPVPARA